MGRSVKLEIESDAKFIGTCTTNRCETALEYASPVFFIGHVIHIGTESCRYTTNVRAEFCTYI